MADEERDQRLILLQVWKTFLKTDFQSELHDRLRLTFDTEAATLVSSKKTGNLSV